MDAEILVVEDEVISAAFIPENLKRSGYEVVDMVTRGLDALKVLLSSHVDLVLMDMKLDGEIDGIETARRIGKFYGTPVVFLTAFSDDTLLKRAKHSEPFGYLIKPVQPASCTPPFKWRCLPPA